MFWIESSALVDMNMLMVCRYFALSVLICVLDTYLESLVERIDITKYILIVGDFNAGGFDWVNRSFPPSCHFYAKASISSVVKFMNYVNLNA